MEAKKYKDNWDKFSVISPFLIFLIGAVLTYCVSQKYQQLQQDKDNRYKEIDLLVKLAPYLSSKDPLQNRVAIYSIRALHYDSLASEIGASLNTIGSREALKSLSNDSTIPPSSRKIYLEKWEKIKNIPPTRLSKDTLKVWADAEGNVMTDADGNPILFEERKLLQNENHNTLLNENGKPLLAE